MNKRFKNWKPPEFDTDGWAYPNRSSVIAGENKYGWRCQYHKNLELGKNVDIGCFTYMNAQYGIRIGDNVQIGSHCSIYSDNTENNTKGIIRIGEGTLIGSHCLILPGVTIEPFSKIRAYSIIK